MVRAGGLGVARVKVIKAGMVVERGDTWQQRHRQQMAEGGCTEKLGFYF